MECSGLLPEYIGGYGCRHSIKQNINIKKVKRMEDKAINITVTGDKENPIITVLEGEYKHPVETHKLKSLVIGGGIETVSHFLASKAALITKDKILIVVDTEKGVITGFTDFDNDFSHKVQGSLIPNKDILDLAINQGKNYSLKELISALKFKKTKFSNEAEFIKLISELQKFNMKVDLEINKSNDQKGNINDSFVQSIKHDLKLDFTMKVPVYKDGPVQQFKVEIQIEVTGTRTCAFFMESYDLNDIQITEKERVLNEEIEKLKEFTIIKQ